MTNFAEVFEHCNECDMFADKEKCMEFRKKFRETLMLDPEDLTYFGLHVEDIGGMDLTFSEPSCPYSADNLPYLKKLFIP